MSLLLGGLWRLVEYRAWMPLSGYRVDAQDLALEERLWSVFPSRCFRFWPRRGSSSFWSGTCPCRWSRRCRGSEGLRPRLSG